MLLAIQVERHGGACALQIPGGEQLSYGDVGQRVGKVSGQLRALNLTGKSRVAIALPNGLNMSIMLLAVTSTAVAAPLNPAYREAEFLSYLNDIGADCIVVPAGSHSSPACAAARRSGIAIVELASDGVTLIASRDILHALNRRSCAVAEDGPLLNPDPDDIAVILLTSGSTGRSKRVPLTHRNLCVSVADVCHTLQLDERDVCLSMWEQFHIGGVTDLLLAPLASGGRIICTSGFDAKEFFKILDDQSPTWFQGVPTTLHEIMAVAEKTGWSRAKTSLRFIRATAAALSPQLMDRIESLFQVPVVQTFGMTEAAPLITTNPLPPGTRKAGSTGPTCGPLISVRDAKGRVLPAYETGEIVVKGENVVAGYEANPEATAQSFRDGWFHTGDTGYLDSDGYLFLKGRIKEQINRGGEKIIPQEIDDVLTAHPEIAQAASFSVKHPTLGEDVGVAVVLRKNSTLDAVGIRRFVASQLSDFKVPRTILFLDSLPRNTIGKVRRETLAALADTEDKSVTYAAPETKLHEILAEVWSKELDKPKVGIDDDFSSLGGDSLSSVRLMLAIETLLGIELEEAALSDIMTIRQLAKLVESRPGYGQGRIAEHEQTEVFGDDQISILLSNIASGVARGGAAVPDTAQGMKAALFACDTERTFDVMLQSFLSELTATELEPLSTMLLGPAEQRHPLRHKFVAAQHLLTDKVLPAASEQTWRRRSLAQCVRLYTSREAEAKKKSLIVGFSSKALRLMLPMWTFLSHIDPKKCDLLFLWDPTRGHYRGGTPGLGANFKDLVASLEKIVSDLRYAKVISFGVSAGGLPAICAGIANRWDSIVTVGNEYPKTQTHLFPMLTRDGSHRAKRQPIRLYYSQLHLWDQASALAVAKMTGGEARAIAGCSSHDALWEVYQRGGLVPLFADFFGEVDTK